MTDQDLLISTVRKASRIIRDLEPGRAILNKR
jgi:hypothetical protein